MKNPRFNIEIVQGDVLEFPADVLVLKYAQAYHGVDDAVSSLLVERGVVALNKLKPTPGSHVWVDTEGLLPSSSVLFVGVSSLGDFGYTEIEDFARRALSIVEQDRPEAERIAITLHGAGYGLDEIEALHSEFRGILGSLNAGKAPKRLNRVLIVERDVNRVTRLRAALGQLALKPIKSPSPRLPKPQKGVPRVAGGRGSRRGKYPEVEQLAFNTIAKQKRGTSIETTVSTLESAGQVEKKPKVFVAMPFSSEMEDVFYFGIQNPVRQLGYICERVDQEAFTGDILDQVRSRIENAELVIADLTGANPNVYLEVGYAWGKARPTVLVINKSDELRFDVHGQRCLRYQSIKHLENQLSNELKNLPPNKKV
ncbi:MAG: nucleoside 2-deoxyribosyltransferase [Acidobacteriia bacterium]|nr:nucleoside 2-deoxyribosyltransferase [Terriglobia bacterium]